MKKSLLSGMLVFFIGNVTHAANIEGVWNLKDADNTQATLDKAVDTVAMEMNFFIRALARPILKKETQICHQWKLAIESKAFLWQCDDESAKELPLNASRTESKGDDDRTIYGTLYQQDDQIVTILESERGKRTDTWKMLNGSTMEYTAKLESEKLPTPLTWTLTYTR